MNRGHPRSIGAPGRVALGVASLALAALLLLGFKAPDASVAAGTAATGGTSGTGGTGATTGSTGSATGSSTTQTFDGAVVNTRYGPVEVEITVSSGKVTAVTAIELPSGGRSGAISDYVAPVLASEALSAQSATLDVVSGATYTSEAYARSLQSALDQAGI